MSQRYLSCFWYFLFSRKYSFLERKDLSSGGHVMLLLLPNMTAGQDLALRVMHRNRLIPCSPFTPSTSHCPESFCTDFLQPFHILNAELKSNSTFCVVFASKGQSLKGVQELFPKVPFVQKRKAPLSPCAASGGMSQSGS